MLQVKSQVKLRILTIFNFCVEIGKLKKSTVLQNSKNLVFSMKLLKKYDHPIKIYHCFNCLPLSFDILYTNLPWLVLCQNNLKLAKNELLYYVQKLEQSESF